jgi:hypothetical protein
VRTKDWLQLLAYVAVACLSVALIVKNFPWHG